MASSDILEASLTVIGDLGEGCNPPVESELSGDQGGGDDVPVVPAPPAAEPSEEKDISSNECQEDGGGGEEETPEEKSSGFCFICHSDILDPPKSDEQTEPPTSKSGVTLTTELNIYFVLKRVLELPPDQLKSYLRHCPYPEEWIKICSTCNQTYVAKCKEIYVELLEVTRRYTSARLELIEVVRKSSMNKEEIGDKKKRQDDEDEEEEQFIFDIGKDTLEFVKEHDYETTLEPEPESLQDLMSSELSEAKLRAKKRTRTVRKTVPANVTVTEEGANVAEKDTATTLEPPNDSMVVTIDPFSLFEGENNADAGEAEDSNIEEDPNESEDEDWNPDEDLNPETAAPDQDIYSTSASSSSEETSEDDSSKPSSSSKMYLQRRVRTRRSKDASDDEDEPRKKRQRRSIREWKKNYRSQYNPSECPICQKVFSNKEYLRSHIHRVHEKKGRLNCKDCDRRFGGREGLFLHMVKVHDLGKPSTTQSLGTYTCKNCDHCFPEEYQLTFHEKFVHTPAQYTCPICDKGFHRETHLEKHLISHKNPKLRSDLKHQLPPGLKPFPCSHCPAQYSDKKSWVKHMKDKHNKTIDGNSAGTSEVMSCPLCRNLFASKGALREHFVLAHEPKNVGTGELPKVTGQSYEIPSNNSKSHRSSRGTRAEVIFKCQVCEKVFEKKAYLRQHQKRTRHGKQDMPLFSIPLHT